jgi:RsiW-degrading membrane proteinase PrsW (M82 family)
MPISFTCSCGRSYRVAEGAAGRQFKCPKCGSMTLIAIPRKAKPQADPKPEAPPQPSSQPGTPAADERARQLARDRYKDLVPEKPATNLLEYAYWLLLLTFIPLAISLLQPKEENVGDRLVRSLQKALPPQEKSATKQKPAATEKKGVPLPLEEPLPREISLNDLIARLPGGRIEGAWLPRKTFVHWAYALLAAGAFLGMALFLFPGETGQAGQLLAIGLFTATVGILLLLLAQVLAEWTQSRILIGRNVILLLLFWIAWAIGFSYRAALDPDISFVPSFLGFTFGVGFCEEVCKLLPLLWRYRVTGPLPWRTACTWGFVSGAGFGVSEGILYSADFYNGIASGDVYLVRFVSCVALHGIWTASAALFLHRFQAILQAEFAWYEYIPRALFFVSIPMILHGLYDTFLKRDMGLLALVTALVSFAWFAWSVERTRARDEAGQVVPGRT